MHKEDILKSSALYVGICVRKIRIFKLLLINAKYVAEN